MKVTTRFALAALLTATFNVPAYAVDLTTIDRTLPKQPHYQSDSPRYCLLVFGAEARSRVWLVQDGDMLYVDENGNGDLTESNEVHVIDKYNRFHVAKIQESATGRVHSNLQLYPLADGRVRMKLSIADKGTQYVGFSKGDKPKFGDRAETAPIIHFNGPMTLGQYAEILTVKSDVIETNVRKAGFRIMIGSQGVGTGTFAAYHCKCRRDKGPLRAELKFPPSKAGGIPIEIAVSLKTSG